MFQEIHVGPHIEKTGGTSFENWLMAVYSPERVLVYSAVTDTMIRGTQLKLDNPLVDKVRARLSETALMPLVHRLAIGYLKLNTKRHIQIEDIDNYRADAIYGHFVADRFDGILPNQYSTVFFREPLDRAISHFLYWRRLHGNVNHRVRPKYSSKITFSDFASIPEMQNYQTKALGRRTIDDFDLVGVTEKLNGFCVQLVEQRGMNLETVNLTYLNVTKNKKSHDTLGVDQGFKEWFYQLNNLDLENYDIARQKVGGVILS